MSRLLFWVACLGFYFCSLVGPSTAVAQQAPGFLTQLTFVDRPGSYEDLERAAADANQAVYNALTPICGTPPGCSPEQQAVFESAEELVDTAEEILTGNAPGNSLGLDDEGLGNALRWTAAEEVLAQGRTATNFTSGQVTGARNRITALRYGARGFSIAGLPGLPTRDHPTLPEAATLGSAGEEPAGVLSRLGGFVNGAYGWGSQDGTNFTSEAAFDYESGDLTLGVDYRIRPELVIGLIGGYSQSEVDFDASKSVVDGGIDSEGFSVGTFGLYTWRDVYVSAFFSYQRMSFDIDRFITYPSLNPNVPSTDTRTTADTDSNAYTASANIGYTYRFGLGAESGFFSGKPFLVEPSFRVEYAKVVIDEFTETDVKGESFALRVDEQDIDSLELTLGLRTSAAVSTSIGVFFPYVRAEWRFQLEDDPRTTDSTYAGLGGVGVATPFSVKGEEVDSDYGMLTVGVQTIVRGGRSRVLGGPTGDRLSIYAEYRRVLELDKIESELLNGGFRYLF